MPHDLHVPGMVPDVRRDETTGAHDACHFRECLLTVANEVEDETGDGDAELVDIEW